MSPFELAELENASSEAVKGLFGPPMDKTAGDVYEAEPLEPPLQLSLNTLVMERISDVVDSVSPEVLESISYSQEDLISSCVIDGRSCDIERDFLHFQVGWESKNCVLVWIIVLINIGLDYVMDKDRFANNLCCSLRLFAC